MVNFVNLRKTGQKWEFESEAALEDFVWANLKKLLKLTPLKRQYRVNGQICDIIAADKNKRLVVLELKNGEDRYIVQQLTRYYDALLEEKPFKEDIDYEQPVQLIAITPNFHRDNLTDRKYNSLPIDFFQSGVLADGDNFCLQLKNIDSGKVSQIKIPYQQSDSIENITAPPRALLNRLAKYPDKQQLKVLNIRKKILSFDKRMQEITNAVSISYGKGKKLCAELRFDSKLSQPVLFLWLPLLSQRQSIGRIRIWTDWKIVSNVAHIKEGVGRIKTLDEWKIASGYDEDWKILTKYGFGRLDSLVAMESQAYISSLKNYMKPIEKISRYDFLDNLVDLALEKWIARL